MESMKIKLKANFLADLASKIVIQDVGYPITPLKEQIVYKNMYRTIGIFLFFKGKTLF